MTQPQWNPMKGLPDAGGQWPPAPYDQAMRAFNVWDAWYAGDGDRLAEFYSSEEAPTRPQQYASGWRGAIAKFFWGRPQQQATHRLHVPAPADLARTSADLLFSQPPRFTIDIDDSTPNEEATQARLDKLMGGPDAGATLLEAAEIQSALGGVFLRQWWDEDISDKVEFDAVSADNAIPEWRYGRLVGVTFWQIVHKDKKAVYRHLERHSPGKIEHALYYGTENTLGSKVSLEEMPETAWAADIVDDTGSIDTGVKGLTASYCPNVKPNRAWRNTPGLAVLGRSDFDGLEPLFDALDSAYSSWMRDLDLGKARIFIDEAMLANRGPGRGAQFDADQEVYTKIKAVGSLMDGGAIQMSQFDIRWQAHAQTCAELINAILRGAGYSASTFSDNDLTVTKTATEVESRDRLSERTRDKKIGYWRQSLSQFSETLVALDHRVFGTDYDLNEIPKVDFPVRPQMSQAAQAGYLSALKAASLISVEQGVRERNPNWGEKEVAAEVERIGKDMKDEYAMGAPPEGDPGFEDPFEDDDEPEEPEEEFAEDGEL